MTLKTFAKILLTLGMLCTAVLAILAVVFWSPDLPRAEMVEKYANSQSQFFTTAGGDQVHFRDQGNAAAPTLVLIHGTSASLHTWEPLVKQLSEIFRLVSFDLPGHGLTGEFVSRDYSRRVMIDTLYELLDHLNIGSASLVGNSLGGGIAWQAALKRPSRVNSLFLIAPSGAPKKSSSQSNIGFKILASKWGQALMQKITPRPLIEKSLIQTVADPTLITDTMTDRYWELLKMQGNRRAMVDLVHSDRNTKAFDQLSEINTPTLLVWGQDDHLLPVDMIRQFEKSLSVSQSLILTNIGHLPQEEAVDTLAKEVIGFCGVYQC